MSDTLTLHLLAQRLPDQLLVDAVDTEHIPTTTESDATYERTLADGTPISIIAHWQPPTPAPNAIERATLAEMVARMDLAPLLPVAPPAPPEATTASAETPEEPTPPPPDAPPAEDA